MDYTTLISIVLNAVFGGSLIVTLVTLRATRHKANAEADAQSISNASTLLLEYNKNIVEPLKTEINDLRKEVRNLKNAIRRANNCRYSDDCPVLSGMQDEAKCDD